MLLKIFKNRMVSSSGTWGTKNENNYEILNFEFPEELEEYNKRIVYYLDNQKVWDPIIDNKAILTNAITTKGSVKAYIWCTKSDEAFETDVDFRTQIFVMNFFENDNADGIVPTPEQVDGFNTMLTAMNEKIEEIDELETTIKNAEAQRQENEETRQNNEKTRQENEQTRQNQEAERERRTDEAIGNIEDKTAEYNQNAEEKTEAFNTNATQKTNDFNSNYTQKVNDFNTNASSKESAFNSNASSKTSAFNSNAETKTNAFNSNATKKTTTFNDNASTKTSEFNSNAESKTSAFNDNATQKTTDFNNNAQAKTDAFDEHTEEMQQEIDELSANMPWNETEQATGISVDDAAKYSRNKLELFGNTEQASYDGKNILKSEYFYPVSANGYNSIVKLVEEGNNYLTFKSNPGNQSSYNIIFPCKPNSNYVYKCKKIILYNKNDEIISESGKWNSSYTGAFSSYTLQDTTGSTMEYTKYVSSRSGALSGTNVPGKYVKFTTAEDETECCISFFGSKADKIKIINPMLYEGTDTDIDYEPYTGGVPSPSPDYPQDIHVVTGNNSVEVQGKNLFNKDGNIVKGKYLDANGNVVNSTGAWYTEYYIPVSPNTDYIVSGGGKANRICCYDENKAFLIRYNAETSTISVTVPNNCHYIRLSNNDEYQNLQLEQGSTATSYVPYYHADYPINLGSIELCKIGDYQDYLYKENGNWYIFKMIGETIFGNTEDIVEYGDKGALKITNRINGYNTSNTSVPKGKCSISSLKARLDIYNASEEGISYNNTDIFIYYKNKNIEEIKSIITGASLYYILKTPTSTQITDETLISQLDALYEHLQLVKGTNNISVTASDLAPYMELSYMQDIKSKLDNLDSRLSLLE